MLVAAVLLEELLDSLEELLEEESLDEDDEESALAGSLAVVEPLRLSVR